MSQSSPQIDLTDHTAFRYLVIRDDRDNALSLIRIPDAACIPTDMDYIPLSGIYSQAITPRECRVEYHEVVDSKLLKMTFAWNSEKMAIAPEAMLRELMKDPVEHGLNMEEVTHQDADLILHMTDLEFFVCRELRAHDNKSASMVFTYVGILNREEKEESP